MTDEQYKKWDEIVNPALDRSRKKQKSDPFEDEIARAIGISNEDKEGAGDIWKDTEEGPDENPPPAGVEAERGQKTWNDERVPQNEKRENALDRWSEEETPREEVKKDTQNKWGNEEIPRDEMKESALDRWSEEETPREEVDESALDRWNEEEKPQEEERESALDRWSEEPPHRNVAVDEPVERGREPVEQKEDYVYDGRGRWERETTPPEVEGSRTRSRREENETQFEEDKEIPFDHGEGETASRVGVREPALDRWSVGEVPDQREKEFSYPGEMSEVEREEYMEKRKKLVGVMSEFVSWKESME